MAQNMNLGLGKIHRKENYMYEKLIAGRFIVFFFFMRILKYISQNLNVHFIIYLKDKNQTKNEGKK